MSGAVGPRLRQNHRRLVMAVILVGLGLLSLACGATDRAARNADMATQHYTLVVEGPTVGRTGEPLLGTLRLRVRRPYHLTRGYPHQLVVRGPTGARPREQRVEAGDWDLIGPNELVETVAFRFPGIGSQRLSAVVKFSVCTEQRCDMLIAEHSWTVEIR